MSAGQPLADADRLPWLALIRSTAERVCREEWRKATAMAGMEGATEGDAPEDWRGSLGRPAVVIACSALKTWYRDILRGEVDATPPGVGDLVSPSPAHHRNILLIMPAFRPAAPSAVRGDQRKGSPQARDAQARHVLCLLQGLA